MSDLVAVAVVDLKAGPVLDWAVAKAIGIETDLFRKADGRVVPRYCPNLFWVDYSPSTDWIDGGNIIDQGCGLFQCGGDTGNGIFWSCSFGIHPDLRSQTGATALEAACKAIVAAKFGDAVTVPRELVDPK